MKKYVIALAAAVTLVAVTPSAGHAKTVKTPKACIQALDAAQEAFSIVADFVGDVDTHVTTVRGAAQTASNAGATTTAVGTFLGTLAASINGLEQKADYHSTRLEAPISIYQTASQKCRGLSGSAL